jgi:hypothetical protein
MQHILLYRCFDVPRIPLIEDLTNGPVSPGSSILVEFDPGSQWFNASLTIAAGWIRSGGVSSYSVYDHAPDNVRLRLKRLGLQAESLESEGKFRIIDWYTFQLDQKSRDKYSYDSLKVADLSILWSRAMLPSGGSPFPGTRYRLGPDVIRISDDSSVILRFNDEKSFVDF